MRPAGRQAGADDTAELGPVVPLLLFEAADCLMALPAAEVTQLMQSEAPGSARTEETDRIDLTDYFTGRRSGGPWLRWARGDRHALLRMERVVEVVPCAIRALTPLPGWLRGTRQAAAFWAAGVQGDEVFLLVDPARLQ